MTGDSLQSANRILWSDYIDALKEGQAMNERRIARIAAGKKARVARVTGATR